MEIPIIILLAGVLVFAAHVFAWLFSFVKVPDVLLLILVGIIVGPILGLLTPEFFGEAGNVFALIVLAVILFEGGIGLRLDVLTKAWRGTTALLLLNFAATMAAVGALVWLAAGVPPLIAFAFGAIVGGTSSAVVIPLLQGINASEEAETTLAVESALTDVLSVVVTTGLLAAYAANQFAATDLLIDVAISFAGALSIGLTGGLMWSVLLHKIRHIENAMFTTPAFMFILFGVAEYFGLSGPIAALAFGVTLGNIVFFKLWLERRHMFMQALLQPLALNERERSFISEVVFILQTFFFVFVGLSIPITNLGVFLFAVALTGIMFAVRLPMVRLTSPRAMPAFDRMYLAVVAPKGLAAAVLATLLIQQSVPHAQFLRDTAFMVIFLSVVVTSVLVFLVSKTPIGRAYQDMVGGPTGEAKPLQSEPPLPASPEAS